MKVVQTNLKDIKPYSKNPRNNKDAVDEVVKSIQNFGFIQPLVLDKKNIIVIGHTRFLAAQKLKLKKVPVVFANDLSPKKIKALRIADNKTGEISTWDFDLLKIELDGLDNMFTGFSEVELLNLLESEGDFDVNEEWEGMPEFSQGDVKSYKSVMVHFKDEQALKQFTSKLKCDITEKTRYIWYPEIEIVHTSNKRYK